ncbi:MAG TPA: ABC transporter substrate-binding protein [Methylomirabilota bacterium]|jgi:putative ABC transport system substrate-binding protein|nr:ABC transporter substrate-binding protein [Methylomirabilota bacterium]
MKRRRFLVTALSAIVAAPLAVGAETARKIGIVSMTPRSPATDAAWDALLSGLREHGWVEPRTLVIERRYAELPNNSAYAAAEDLVRSGVEVIVVASTPAALAARQATRTIPIVMTVPSDPVAVGLVASLARPGGNVTGLSLVGREVAGKQVQLLKDVVPGLSSIAVLANSTNPSHAPRTSEVIASARALGLRVDPVDASTRDGVGNAFPIMMKRGVGAAVVLPDALYIREVNTVVRLAAEHRLPAIYGLREAALAGGLMSYGPNFADSFRRAAGYVDRILRGAHPSDLPVEQASRFELIINVKAAKALGLTIPASLRLRADEVIE